MAEVCLDCLAEICNETLTKEIVFYQKNCVYVLYAENKKEYLSEEKGFCLL